jgi:heptosyltransferase-1
VTAVLLVRLSAMGDVLQSLGAIASLHAARPAWRTTFVTQTTFAPLLQGVAGVDRVVTFERRGGVRAVVALRRELRRERFDHALDLQGNWKSAFVAWLSGAPDRVGIAGPWRQEPRSRVLLRRTIRADDGELVVSESGPAASSGRPVNAAAHPADVAVLLVRALAPDAVRVSPPALRATTAELAAERAALAALGIDAGRPFLVVVVTDPRDPRALRPAVVAETVRSVGLPVVQLAGPAEAGLEPPAAAPWLRHERGEVRRLIALGNLVAAAGGRVLGPDQGATHVLAAAGARCRVAFGAQDWRRTMPVGVEVVVHPAPPACAPCRARRCTHPDGPVCMDFAPDRVVPVDTTRSGAGG